MRRPKRLLRSGTPASTRDVAADRFPAWHSSRPAAQVEDVSPGRAAESIRWLPAGLACAGNWAPASIERSGRQDWPADPQFAWLKTPGLKPSPRWPPGAGGLRSARFAPV